MMASGLAVRRFFLSLVACCSLAAGYALEEASAQETCGEAVIGSCYPQYLTFTALTATDDGYTAIGVIGSDLVVLRLNDDADIVDSFYLPPPDWLQGGDLPSIDKLVAGPNGDVMGVGTFTSGSQQYGAIFFLSASGETRWSTYLFVDNESSIILYSGAYDPAEQRYLAVGRHTDGADSGSCTKWSRGLILSVRESDIDALQSDASILGVHFEGPPEPGLENRVAFYDIAPTDSRGQFVASGFATAPNPDGNGCQDNAVAVLVRGGVSTQWNISPRYLIGAPSENEVAFAVAPSGERSFLMGGQGADAGSGARAAFLAEFDFSNTAPKLRNDPFPEDGSDNSGGDRYRTLVSLNDGSFVAAGSVSESRRARNQGFWRIQPPGLAAPGPANFLTRESGSDIFAAAKGRDGRVLAVGRHGTDRDDVGWMGFIYGMKITVDRRAPDGALDLLTPQQASAGSLTLSENEIAGGYGFRDIRFGAGFEYEVRFTLSGESAVAVSALPLDGDLDLALLDREGRVRAMSSNLDDAGEFVLADLEPGEYALRIIAVSDVSEYELRIRSGVSLAEPVLDALNALGPSGRQKLAALLTGSGYDSPANADIGFGAGSLGTLLAYYNTFNTVIDAAGVQQFIASASLSADAE
jgi:hypothetical protein